MRPPCERFCPDKLHNMSGEMLWTNGATSAHLSSFLHATVYSTHVGMYACGREVHSRQSVPPRRAPRARAKRRPRSGQPLAYSALAGPCALCRAGAASLALRDAVARATGCVARWRRLKTVVMQECGRRAGGPGTPR